MTLTTIQRDRAIGAILGMACGDALGAPYEFKPPVSPEKEIVMKAGGGWALGEWTDDTSMAIAILKPMSEGKYLREPGVMDSIVAAWSEWAKTAPDVGMQTRAVLSQAATADVAGVIAASKALHEKTGRTAGNGSLMRTSPVAIAALGSGMLTAELAIELSKLTHWDHDATHACILWCLAIRHAVSGGGLDIRAGLPYLESYSAQRWEDLISEAEANEPAYFAHNGWVVHAFQAAWSAIYRAKNAPATMFRHEADRLAYGLEQAVRAGYDTDTVAAIAGSLLGAHYGYTAIPLTWRTKLHGWPGIGERQLVAMVNSALNRDEDINAWPNISHMDYSGWGLKERLFQHPGDPGLWLGGAGSLSKLPPEVTAVVSLCRMGRDDVPQHISERIEIMLLDEPSADKNLNLEFLLDDVAAAVAELRARGEVVFLHCVQAESRTPAVALAYSVNVLGRSFSEAKAELAEVFEGGLPRNRYFQEVLKRSYGQ